MTGQITRKVFRLNSSKVLTLPQDWTVKNGEVVTLIYDRLLLVIPAEFSAEIESATEKTIASLLTAFKGASDSE